MGRERGRGAALTEALAATLRAIADLLADARDPWWVIGSAAVMLHGGETEARDVDVLLSVRDATAAAERLGITPARGGAHPLFRSSRFFVWSGPPLPIEFMADFAVRRGEAWWSVAPMSRQRVTIGAAAVFVPARDDLRTMLRRFGRPKDLARAALLAPRAPPRSPEGEDPAPQG